MSQTSENSGCNISHTASYLNSLPTNNLFEAQDPRQGTHGVPTDPMQKMDFAYNLHIRIQDSRSITIRLHCFEFADLDQVWIRFYAHFHFQSVFLDGSRPIFASHSTVLIKDSLQGLIKKMNVHAFLSCLDYRMVWCAVRRVGCRAGSVDLDRHVCLCPGTVKGFANRVLQSNYGSVPETGPAFHSGPVCYLNFVLPSA